jgi:hypothetical protein
MLFGLNTLPQHFTPRAIANYNNQVVCGAPKTRWQKDRRTRLQSERAVEAAGLESVGSCTR